jgi:uncharacterized iron-regulated protein
MYYVPMNIIRRLLKPAFFIPTSITVALILAAALPILATPYGDYILRLSNRTTLGLGQILPDLKETPLIFMGEQHTDTRHHDLQLRVLRTLHNLGTPVVVGLEMFTARDQQYLNSWVHGTLSEKEFIKAHERNWGNTWKLYSSIYFYAREKGIHLIGLNVPEEITTLVANKGFSSLSPNQRSQLPLVSCYIDEKYMSFIKTALSVHEPPETSRNLESFCEAQLIWDTAMAFRLVRQLERNPGVTVIVIAGNSHSWRPGIPEQLSRFGEGIDYRIILPEVPPVQTRNSIDGTVADYLWLME